jgi:hypothetical protein
MPTLPLNLIEISLTYSGLTTPSRGLIGERQQLMISNRDTNQTLQYEFC